MLRAARAVARRALHSIVSAPEKEGGWDHTIPDKDAKEQPRMYSLFKKMSYPLVKRHMSFTSFFVISILHKPRAAKQQTRNGRESL